MTKRIHVSILFIAVASLSGCVRLIERTYSGPNDVAITAANHPLPASAFKAKLHVPVAINSKVQPGEMMRLRVVVTNLSDVTWPSGSDHNSTHPIHVGNHWLNAQGKVIIADDGRGSLPYDVQPGNSAEVLLVVKAPAQTGNYTLEIDVVQENVGWFKDHGSTTLKLPVSVLDHE